MNKIIAILISNAILYLPLVANAAEIDWAVADRFRLFLADQPPTAITRDRGESAQDVFLSRLARADAAPPQSSPELAIYEVIRDFLGRDAAGPGPLSGWRPYQATHWRGHGPGPRQKPSPIRTYTDNYLYPSVYTVRAWILRGRASDECRWSASGALEPISAPCDSRMRIPIRSLGDHSGGAPTEIKVTVWRGGVQIDSAATRITFRDRLILALGDSYAAGEGNPDRPQSYLGAGNSGDTAFRKAVSEFWSKPGADPYERWWRDPGVLGTLTPAQWWDPICHRSLYSQQLVATYLLSARRPKEAVTFVSFACSGAEILDGVLAPQLHPPGVDDFDWPEANRARPLSQIEDALSLLCRNRLANSVERRNLYDVADNLDINTDQKENLRKHPLARRAVCADGHTIRKIDAVLLSIGGNDIGFSGAVKNTLFPYQASNNRGQSILDIVRNLIGVTPTYIANRKAIYTLPELYKEVKFALRDSLVPAQIPVIQSPYPNPLWDQGQLIDPSLTRTVKPTPGSPSFCDGFDDNRLFSAMHGILPDRKVAPAQRWRIDINAAEGRDVYDGIVNPLNAAVRANADSDWSVLSFGDKFDRRGWCAGDTRERQTFAFPGLAQDGEWTSFDPAQWDAYAPQRRLFRTANDVVLTQIGSDKRVLGSHANRSFFALSGMFHPTAQGHALMGLIAAEELDRKSSP
jgi:hypothetical protein